MSATAEQAIMTRLVADTGVSAIVGQKIYPHSAPQSVDMPYIVYQRIDATHEHNMLGGSGLYTARIQIDMYALSYSAVLALAQAVRTALQGYRGYVTVGTDTVKIGMCHLAGDQEFYIDPQDSSQKGIYRLMHDYMVSADESQPAHAG